MIVVRIGLFIALSLTLALAEDEVIKCPGGECVKLHLCRDGTIVTDGSNLIDIRFNPDDPCEHYLLKCCAIPDDQDGEIIEPPSTGETEFIEPPSSGSQSENQISSGSGSTSGHTQTHSGSSAQTGTSGSSGTPGVSTGSTGSSGEPPYGREQEGVIPNPGNYYGGSYPYGGGSFSSTFSQSSSSSSSISSSSSQSYQQHWTGPQGLYGTGMGGGGLNIGGYGPSGPFGNNAAYHGVKGQPVGQTGHMGHDISKTGYGASHSEIKTQGTVKKEQVAGITGSVGQTGGQPILTSQGQTGSIYTGKNEHNVAQSVSKGTVLNQAGTGAFHGTQLVDAQDNKSTSSSDMTHGSSVSSHTLDNTGLSSGGVSSGGYESTSIHNIGESNSVGINAALSGQSGPTRPAGSQAGTSTGAISGSHNENFENNRNISTSGTGSVGTSVTSGHTAPIGSSTHASGDLNVNAGDSLSGASGTGRPHAGHVQHGLSKEHSISQAENLEASHGFQHITSGRNQSVIAGASPGHMYATTESPTSGDYSGTSAGASGTHAGQSHQGGTHAGQSHQGGTHAGQSHQGGTHAGQSHQGGTHTGQSHQGGTKEHSISQTEMGSSHGSQHTTIGRNQTVTTGKDVGSSGNVVTSGSYGNILEGSNLMAGDLYTGSSGMSGVHSSGHSSLGQTTGYNVGTSSPQTEMVDSTNVSGGQSGALNAVRPEKAGIGNTMQGSGNVVLGVGTVTKDQTRDTSNSSSIYGSQSSQNNQYTTNVVLNQGQGQAVSGSNTVKHYEDDGCKSHTQKHSTHSQHHGHVKSHKHKQNNYGSGYNNMYHAGTTVNPIRPPQEQLGCGFRNPDGVGFRITGDTDGESEYGEFPWMVAILKEEKALDQVINVYQCGGSLIHPRVVLTAAHCVQNKKPNEIKVRLGEWDTQTTNEIHDHQDRNVFEIVVHDKFYKGGLFNDFALLFLDQPAEIIETVNTVCLPPQDFNFDLSRCFASGWGKDVFGKEGKYQVILKKIELPIMPFNQCQDALRTTRLGKRFILNKSFICAGGEPKKDTCKGDGGSPLVCPIPGSPNRFYQAGIVAWGIGCGEHGIPGVYANVAGFRNWIDEHLTQRSISHDYYIPV